MKKLALLISILFMCFVSKAQSRPSYDGGSKQTTGALLTVGGIGFTVAGFLTPPIYTGQYVSNGTGQSMSIKNTQAPFYQQGPRFGCIVTGVTVSVCGLISLLSNK